MRFLHLVCASALVACESPRDPFGGDNRNYLGLRDAVIDFYEVDDTTSGEGCAQTSLVGGVTTAASPCAIRSGCRPTATITTATRSSPPRIGAGSAVHRYARSLGYAPAPIGRMLNE